MAWFNDKKGEKKNVDSDEIPQLEELPKLPELPKIKTFDDDYSKSTLPKEMQMKDKLQPLPSIPQTKYADKFSQDMIKDAVRNKGSVNMNKYNNMQAFAQNSNDMEEDNELENEEEFDQLKPMVPTAFRAAAKKVGKIEPIFVRLDKFEDSLDTFEKMKKSVEEIKDLLKQIKEKKSQEEQELQKWESELQAMKAQIERIDSDIFSKLE